MRCHDGKAQLIVACKAQLMSGLEPYELAHISSPGAAHLGPMWTRLAWSPRRQRELEDKGGVNHGTALKKSKKESFRNFFATQIATKSAQIATKFLRNWTLPKLRKKLHATLAKAK